MKLYQPQVIFSFLSLSLLVFSLLSATAEAYCNSHHKKVLFKIKEALGNPYVLISWNNNLDCCEWNNLECDETTRRVISISVMNSDIVGPIPDAVGDLPYLQTLLFHKNPNLTGEIPIAITKLTQLRYLWLSWNNLTGLVPSFISQLKNLEYINLAFNQLTGSIPPELSSLPKLGYLGLDRNKLTGSIPESFSSINVTDFYLILSHNQLSGPIPKSLSNVKFAKIDLSRNHLVGDAFMLFRNNSPSDFSADLSRNNLSFDLSKTVFPTRLIYLDLNHNNIYGSIPHQLANIELQFFNVSYNRLCGKIPTGGTGRLQSRFDEYCYFHNKCLCGAPLPSCK
ncbi:Leucine-rich repeat-containing N-terminal, plant-type [Dillenia turbinata]|uniref:Leucine-rich repeat-containing N-terminal, plant-type n=1 Tax=Dillenia turbinata TaxID=194707 RepID=A0AAN8VX47_9MAGN